MTPTERIRKIYGHGAVQRFARAMGIRPGTISGWQDEWPQYALTVLEWLEETPEKYWPDRWQRQ